MYASVQKTAVSPSMMFRYCARAGALIIVTSWLALVIAEFIHNGPPAGENYYQGMMLAIVFVGYAIGWRNEFVGGGLALAGATGFSVLNGVMVGYSPVGASLGFAAPGLFYLIAHYLDRENIAAREWRP